MKWSVQIQQFNTITLLKRYTALNGSVLHNNKITKGLGLIVLRVIDKALSQLTFPYICDTRQIQ